MYLSISLLKSHYTHFHEIPENVTYFRFASDTGQQQSEKGGTSINR